jgi:hypothetical protein
MSGNVNASGFATCSNVRFPFSGYSSDPSELLSRVAGRMVEIVASETRFLLTGNSTCKADDCERLSVCEHCSEFPLLCAFFADIGRTTWGADKPSLVNRGTSSKVFDVSQFTEGTDLEGR